MFPSNKRQILKTKENVWCQWESWNQVMLRHSFQLTVGMSVKAQIPAPPCSCGHGNMCSWSRAGDADTGKSSALAGQPSIWTEELQVPWPCLKNYGESWLRRITCLSLAFTWHLHTPTHIHTIHYTNRHTDTYTHTAVHANRIFQGRTRWYVLIVSAFLRLMQDCYWF